jgi:3-hydroxybutyrate dehydrogenase
LRIPTNGHFVAAQYIHGSFEQHQPWKGQIMLTGKTAVVTGSTSGIGLAIAEALAAQGANVAINSYTDREDDHAAAARIAETHGVEAAYIKADMSDGAAARDLIEQAVSRFSAVDILVNNAGIQYVAPVDEFPAEKWDAVIAINLSATFHTIAAAVPHMRASGWGRIINIASAHGLRASPNKSAYVASKHGVVGLTKVVALEEAEKGITCNAICPGYVLTPLVEQQIEDRMRESGLDRREAELKFFLDKHPSKQFVTLEEISGAAVFLAGNAAAQITGTTLSVDGGWTAE